MNQPLDERQLQRLVDGVLTDTERSEFLARLVGRPDLWREVALAFVEEQIWVESVPGHDPSRNVALSSERVDVAPGAVSAKAAANTKPWGAWTRRLAMAVSLLIVLGLGMWTGQKLSVSTTTARPLQPRSEHATDPTVIANQQDTRESAPVFAAVDAPTHAPQVQPARLQIEYGNGQSRQALEVPVLPASQVPSRVWDEDRYRAEIEQINRELASSGYRLESETEFLGGDLSNGNRLVVPVRTISLRQRGQ